MSSVNKLELNSEHGLRKLFWCVNYTHIYIWTYVGNLICIIVAFKLTNAMCREPISLALRKCALIEALTDRRGGDCGNRNVIYLISLKTFPISDQRILL